MVRESGSKSVDPEINYGSVHIENLRKLIFSALSIRGNYSVKTNPTSSLVVPSDNVLNVCGKKVVSYSHINE